MSDQFDVTWCFDKPGPYVVGLAVLHAERDQFVVLASRDRKKAEFPFIRIRSMGNTKLRFDIREAVVIA